MSSQVLPSTTIDSIEVVVNDDLILIDTPGLLDSGDIIEFIQRIEKIDYISAVKLLAERSGVKITEDAEDNYYIKMRNKIT